jgi:hypothetical protein
VVVFIFALDQNSINNAVCPDIKLERNFENESFFKMIVFFVEKNVNFMVY